MIRIIHTRNKYQVKECEFLFMPCYRMITWPLPAVMHVHIMPHTALHLHPGVVSTFCSWVPAVNSIPKLSVDPLLLQLIATPAPALAPVAAAAPAAAPTPATAAADTTALHSVFTSGSTQPRRKRCWTYSHHYQIADKNPSKRWNGEFRGVRICIGWISTTGFCVVGFYVLD